MTLVSHQCGIFPRWPTDGLDWVHPEDLHQLLGLIPSHRIFRRTWRGGEFAELNYGDVRVRVRPVLWEPVPDPEFTIGDEVEICSLMGQNDPGLATIREVYWDRELKCAQYELDHNGMRLARKFNAGDLRPATFLTSYD